MSQSLPDDSKISRRRGPGFSITSLVIGILLIVVVPAMLGIEVMNFWTMTGVVFSPILYLFSICINLAGLIFGIIGLKSSKKGMAITGITLCSLVFISYIFAIYSVRVL